MDREIIEPPAKKRKQYTGSYQDDWKRVFNGVIAPSKLGDHHAWCVVCSRDVNVSASGVYDVRMQLKTKIHDKNAKSTLQHAVDRLFQTKDPDACVSVLRLAARFASDLDEETQVRGPAADGGRVDQPRGGRSPSPT